MTILTPATVRLENGVLRAPAFDDVYHSADGGIAQCTRVFLEGNTLPARWLGAPSFQILETGFGIGLNFLVTWNAWRNTANLSASRLHFVSFEKFPLTRADLAASLKPFSSLSPLADALLGAWPPLVAGVHRIEFEQGRVLLTLLLGDIQDLLPQLSMAADAVFLDGFAPAKNPQMWDDRVMRHIARQCTRQATLATWCVAGAVRRSLEHHGFSVSRRPGFGTKRERLEACFDKIPQHAFNRMVTPSRNPVLARVHHAPIKQRQAIIVGAGIAGCLMAERLARGGWQVSLFDRHTGPAQEATGNPAGILRPVLAQDDNLAARLGRAGFLHTLRTLARLQGETGLIRHKLCGVLLLAQDAVQAAVQRAIITRYAYPADYVRFLEPAEAQQLSGTQTRWGGWYFPQGGWVDPRSLCNAALTAGRERIQLHWQTGVATLEKAQDWCVLDAQGRSLAQAPVLILALGAYAKALPQTAGLPITLLRGQLTLIDADPFAPHSPVLCQEGYVISGLENGICIGATYDDGLDAQPRASSTQENLARLKRLMPAWTPDPATVTDRVGFRSVARDRMPLVGTLSGAPGLYGVLGMGSHGLIWSSLAAELIAAELEGEPLPLEQDLIQAITPARFGPPSPARNAQ